MRKPDPRPLWQHLLALGAVTLAIAVSLMPARSTPTEPTLSKWSIVVIVYDPWGDIENSATLPGTYNTFDQCMAAALNNKSLQAAAQREQRDEQRTLDGSHIDITCESELD